MTLPGLEFEHIDFNQADPYLAKVQVRQAIAHGVNRQSIIARTVGQISKGITPLGQPHAGAVPEGLPGHELRLRPGPVGPLLKKLGFKKGSDGYFQPNYGPQKGKDLTFTIQSTVGQHHPLADRGPVPGPDEGDRHQDQHSELRRQHLREQPAERGRTRSPSSPGSPRRLSRGTSPSTARTPNANSCGFNWTHSANAQVDALMSQGSAAAEHVRGDQRLQQGRRHSVAEHGHAAAVPGAAVLRLVEQPEGRAAEHRRSVGVTWNAEDWSISS